MKAGSSAIAFWKFINLQCIYCAAVQGLSIAVLSEGAGVRVGMLLAATKIFSPPHHLM